MFLISIMDITPLLESLSTNMEFYNKALFLIPEKRRNKTNCIKNSVSKCQTLGAGLLLNFTVKKFLNSKNTADRNTFYNTLYHITAAEAANNYDKEYDYETDVYANGKPYYKYRPQLHFNLSHAGNYAVCIVSDTPCGIDIEGNRKLKTNVAERFFSKAENTWIADSSDSTVKVLRFFRLWTLKEAYAKVTGLGIAAELQSALYMPDFATDGISFANPDISARYDLFEYSHKDYCIAAILQKWQCKIR